MYNYNSYPRREKSHHYVQPLSVDEEHEVNQLVELFHGMGFTSSTQLSRYIRDHRLGFQFPNISGFLELTRDDDGFADTWEFEGGIKPKFYAEVCSRLGLSNNRSRARVSGFESYKQRNYINLV